MEKLRIVFDWFPNTIHAGILSAKKHGLYEEAGLDVEIEGQVHHVMDPSMTDMICGPEISMLANMEQGISLIGIAQFTQKCDSGLVSLKEAGITRMKDLEGKRLTYWDLPWFHPVMKYLVEKDGGDYSKVKKVQMDVDDIVATLGDVADATWVYENWEKYALITAGKEVNYVRFGDLDPIFNFCAPAIAATGNAVASKSEALRRFLKVTDLSYRDIAQHPEKILEVRDMIPEASGNEMLLKGAEHLSGIWCDQEGRWGRIKPEMWNQMADFLVRQNVIRQRREREFTNEFFGDEQ
ncbi:MAG: ABC transporter substrate-binding protein [Bulleidia sp.]